MKIVKGDFVEIIKGSKKGTTGKVVAALPKKNAVLIEGVGQIHRKLRPSALNPRGGHKDVHIPVPIYKVRIAKKTSGKETK